MNSNLETKPTETTINPDYLQNGCTRAEALRTGQLHDITCAPAIRTGRFAVPTAITAGLWRTLAGEQAFSQNHPILLQLVRALAAAVLKDRYERRQRNLFSETAWIRVPLAGQTRLLKLVCHAGDTAAPVMTLMLDSESGQIEL